jgi:hypothetical protein
MTGEQRLIVGTPRPGHRREQHLPRLLRIHAEHVIEDQRAQYRGHLLDRHVLDPERYPSASSCQATRFAHARSAPA